MRKKSIFESYDFTTMEEFYNYIVESKINGNYSQVAKLIKEMSKKDTRSFIQWCETERDGQPASTIGDYIYCQSLATDILSGSN